MNSLPPEILVLALSVVLLVVLIAIHGACGVRQNGNAYAAGARNVPIPDGIRLGRALANFLETYPAFIALSLALVVTQTNGGLAETGAWIWLVARVAHAALYLAGIAVIRTLAFAASVGGLVLMLARLLGWL